MSHSRSRIRDWLSRALVACTILALPSSFPALRADEALDRAIQSLLESMPADTAAQERELLEPVARDSEEAVVALAARLGSEEGKRSTVEYAISGLATYASRPGATAERAGVERGLIRAIEAVENVVDRGFLLTTLERVASPKSIDLLVRFVTDETSSNLAIRSLVAIGTPEAAQALHDSLPKSWGRARVQLIDALARLGRSEAAKDLLDLAEDEDDATRHTTWLALASFATPEATDALTSILEKARLSSSVTERRAAYTALLRLAERLGARGNVERAAGICKALIHKAETASTESDRTPTHVRVAALDVLVGVAREQAFGEVLQALRHEDPQIRAAAARLAIDLDAPASERRDGESGREAATRKIAELLADANSERAIDITRLLGARGDASALPALRRSWESDDPQLRLASLRAAARIEERPLAPLWARAVEEAEGETRAALLASAGSIGGAETLRVLAQSLKDENPVARDAAARALSEWRDPGAVDIILDAFRSAEDGALRLRVLDSYLRLVRMARFARPRVLAHWNDALAATRDPEEVRRVLDAFGGLKMLASLEILSGYFDDERLGEDAARAAIRAALPRQSGQGGLRGYRVVDIVTKAIERVKDDRLRSRAREYLETLPAPDTLNLAEHRPVRASVPQQGEHFPELAVDGDAISEDSAWFGARWPASLEIDLEEEHELGGARIHFWHADGRVYRYTIEASRDGKEWTRVVDRSENTDPSTREGFAHKFSPVTARHLRLTITHNSANEAVHVLEVKVYAAGKLPEGFGG
ncbi:MAG TPA: HEAT repeat domain-containing protein [Planctomycetota bacterium]|nr:HEAT repeat domain-containing protein [Planctomycetota bacterium]